MKVLIFYCIAFNCFSSALIKYHVEKNISIKALALSEIINGLKPISLVILIFNDSHKEIVDDFIYELHKFNIKTCVFFDSYKYFDFIKDNILTSIESTSLIFADPNEIMDEITERNLAHRLNLFMFFSGKTILPNRESLRFTEPMRVVIITNPRLKVFRIFYNQADSTAENNLRLINWYDGENLGLHKIPLLPKASVVYSNFKGRIFDVPVIHSPPWHFVVYFNNTNEANITMSYLDYSDEKSFKVAGGRDHQLLCLLGEKMNFKFQYVDPEERTQGSAIKSEENDSFTGGLGMIQDKQADFLFGDITLSWERRKAVEFSFFTLADSGAFVTHAPRRLNEALALFRPFKKNVWPFLILTVLLSGPLFYFIIVIPYYWKDTKQKLPMKQFHMKYINEIYLGRRFINNQTANNKIPEKLLDRCIWFTLKLFLKQSCSEPYHGCRARFLVMIFWIAATYVLADVYSAQLTSQFARPAREGPMDTLAKLENAMRFRQYQLFVEKDSSSLDMLENSTEIFRRLYKLMKTQKFSNDRNGYLIDSVEDGIRMILHDPETVILGGRETLHFNIKRYGSKNFQLSYKLYTRYSAVAVQIGCPFLESLNNVLIRLFESGILEKITNSEYEKMSRLKNGNYSDHEEFENVPQIRTQNIKNSEIDIQPLNVEMLQGAFIILLFGYIIAGIILLFETLYYNNKLEFISDLVKLVQRTLKLFRNKILTAITFVKGDT